MSYMNMEHAAIKTRVIAESHHSPRTNTPNQDGEVLPAEQAPATDLEAEDEEATPTAPAPPRAAEALPKGALASKSKPALRAGGAARR